jgi:phage protein D
VEAFSASRDLIAKAKARAAQRGFNKSGFFRYCLAKELGYSEKQSLEMAAHSSVTQLKAQVHEYEMNDKPNSKADVARAKLLGGGEPKPVSYRRTASKKSATGKRPAPISNEAL